MTEATLTLVTRATMTLVTEAILTGRPSSDERRWCGHSVTPPIVLHQEAVRREIPSSSGALAKQV